MSGPSLEQRRKSPENKSLGVPRIQKIEGIAIAFGESGTEGFFWMVEDQKCPGAIAGLHMLNNGDTLKITSQDDQVLFHGQIDQDDRIGRCSRYQGDLHGQPTAMGCWIHWTQKGWAPDAWAALFFNEANKAELIPGPNS